MILINIGLIMKSDFYFRVFSNNCFIKILVIMSKKVISVIYEVLKAIIYALGGFFGGNAIM